MKPSVNVFQVMIIVAAVLLVAASPQAQENTESQVQVLDTRIWSQSYWLKMAELGLVEVEICWRIWKWEWHCDTGILIWWIMW